MRNLWLFFDSNYLCWRAFHSTGELSYKSIPTGILFGYLKALIDIQGLFTTTKVAHCFDRGQSKRKEIYPEYKGTRARNRDDLTEEQKTAFRSVRNQIIRLRKEHLPEIGCKNIFSYSGYEADDIIATLCQTLPEGHEGVIISSDQDLFQLLSPRIRMYSPKTKQIITENSFRQEWGIEPKQWVMVKALAGCSSDNVKGIKGVGEKTAVKHLRKELKTSSKTYSKILDEYSTAEKNLPLVTLPFPGCKQFILVEDTIDKIGWEALTDRFGLKSIRSLRAILPFNINS